MSIKDSPNRAEIVPNRVVDRLEMLLVNIANFSQVRCLVLAFVMLTNNGTFPFGQIPYIRTWSSGQRHDLFLYLVPPNVATSSVVIDFTDPRNISIWSLSTDELKLNRPVLIPYRCEIGH